MALFDLRYTIFYVKIFAGLYGTGDIVNGGNSSISLTQIIGAGYVSDYRGSVTR